MGRYWQGSVWLQETARTELVSDCITCPCLSGLVLPRCSVCSSGCTGGFQNTFSCYSCSPLWSMCPSPGCTPPQCSAAAGRHIPRWHRGARSPRPHQRGCGLSSWDGTSPSDWRQGRTLPPRSGNHLHKNLLLKLKHMRPLA